MPAYLVIEKGSPFEAGDKIVLAGDKTIIGRSTKNSSPHIAFDNILISRNHCCISYDQDAWSIIDLSSKHGTVLNTNTQLKPHFSQELIDGDKVSLASGIVLFKFYRQDDGEHAIECCHGEKEKTLEPQIEIDQDRRQVIINGDNIPLTTKQCQLMVLLFSRPKKLISYDEVCNTVWPDRGVNGFTNHYVGLEEIDVLVYRLRKRIEPFDTVIRTIRGRGLIFELDVSSFH
ncbi:MAG: transcriptional regulator, CadC [Firmicutes bacterium]|nr:transcriptional regulator, CadC [Bacillota bacterium]